MDSTAKDNRDDRHLETDELAALALGGLDPTARQRAEAHLVSGCARCAEERAWIARTVGLARSDLSVAPPDHVLARAVRIFDVERAAAEPRGSAAGRLWRRLRALPLFENAGGTAPALAGVRGVGDGTRQVLYGVAELDLEIDLQVRRQGADLLDVRGQVFAANDDMATVAGLAVEVPLATAASEETVASISVETSSVGAFSVVVPWETPLLILRARDHEIEIPVPAL